MENKRNSKAERTDKRRKEGKTSMRGENNKEDKGTVEKMQKTKQKDAKKKILVVSNGTFCDGTLMEDLIGTLQGHQVIYATDVMIPLRNATSSSIVSKTYTFSTPLFVFTDPSLGAADPRRSPISWALMNPQKVVQVHAWIKEIGKLIIELETAHRPDIVLFHFSLSSAVIWANHNAPLRGGSLLGSRPHVAVYFNPAVPNSTIPWLFDGILRRPEFRLYDRTLEHLEMIRMSWYITLSRMSMSWGSISLKPDVRDVRAVESALLNIHHVTCWDGENVPPLSRLFEGLRSEHTGVLIKMNGDDDGCKAQADGAAQNERMTTRARKPVTNLLANDDKLPDSVESFINRFNSTVGENRNQHRQRQRRRHHPPIAFLSFGSFGSVPDLRAVIPRLCTALYEKLGYASIFHDTSSPDGEREDPSSFDYITSRPFFLRYRGYIRYDAVVPRVGLVGFTGSMCLQMTCFKHAVPMVFVPFLTEQYFWAKNYWHFTSVPYLDVDSKYVMNDENVIETKDKQQSQIASPEYIVHCLTKASQQKKVESYLNRVKNSMLKSDGRQAFRRLVETLIRENEVTKHASGALISPRSYDRYNFSTENMNKKNYAELERVDIKSKKGVSVIEKRESGNNPDEATDENWSALCDIPKGLSSSSTALAAAMAVRSSLQ